MEDMKRCRDLIDVYPRFSNSKLEYAVEVEYSAVTVPIASCPLRLKGKDYQFPLPLLNDFILNFYCTVIINIMLYFNLSITHLSQLRRALTAKGTFCNVIKLCTDKIFNYYYYYY